MEERHWCRFLQTSQSFWSITITVSHISYFTPIVANVVSEGPNGLVCGQSMAILRLVGRKAGLAGDSDAEFVVSEQLIEEG
jgi:hypothetical protein